MRYKLSIVVAVIIVLAVVALTSIAGAGTSFGGSNRGSIIYTVITTGDFDTLIVHMSGHLDATCRNLGGNEAPGQFAVAVDHYGEVSDLTRNTGENTYTFTFPDPINPAPSWSEAGCPNENWTVSRLSGWLSGTTSFTGTNGRVRTHTTSCFYDSNAFGAMPCTISD